MNINVTKKKLVIFRILLGIAIAFCLISVLCIFIEVSENREEGRYDARMESVYKVYGTPAIENIGKLYEGNATAGYTFYRVDVPILNQGTEAQTVDYINDIEVEGEEYDDVECYYSSSEYNPLSDEYNIIVPSGCVANVSKVVMIKDGVSKVKVTYREGMVSYNTYEDYNNEDLKTFEIQL